MKFLYDATLPELEEWVREKGYPKFRAGQIYRWIARGAVSFDAMTDLSKDVRAALAADYFADGAVILHKLVSQIDGTIKYILKLKDGNIIECVLMRYHHGNSICISSQAGCRMGCRFCASTKAGFGRNLSGGEMLAQVAIVSADIGERISNIVIMGIGEPLDNFASLLWFLKAVNEPDGLGIGMRHISVSTCGLVPEMLKFTKEGLPVTLSISLHAPNDEIRRSVMPIAGRYSMKELLDACAAHIRATNRRITFEYALFAGVNDRPEHAKELAGRLRGMLCHVNLIPANEFEGSELLRSSKESVRKFQDILTENGINATVRRELGADILAACGQLRRQVEEGERQL